MGLPGTELGKKTEQLWPGKKERSFRCYVSCNSTITSNALYSTTSAPKSQLKESRKDLESVFGSGCGATEVRKTLTQEIPMI